MNGSGEGATDERRRYPRKSCRIDAGCAYFDKDYETVVKNISKEGARVGTPPDVVVGQELALTLMFPEGERAAKVIGVVVWVNNDSFGVRFKMGFDASLFDI